MIATNHIPRDRLRGTQEFADWFNDERMRRRMTQNEVEAAIGASGGVISKWARGITAPSPRLLYRLAELWGSDIDRLLTMTGYRPQEDGEDLTDPRANLMQLLKLIELTPERTSLLTTVMENMWAIDKHSMHNQRAAD